MCRGDEDCGGRKCLLGAGVCVDELVGEDPLGVACDPAAEENTCVSSNCAGGITEGTAAVGYCSGLCTFGVGGCGSTSVMPEKAGDPSCFPAFSGGGRGDMGLCIQTCNCDDDCDADKFVCAQIPGAFEALGVQGFCFEFDLAISSDSEVVLGVECIESDAGGDAMSHADTGAFDASPLDAALGDAAAVTADATAVSNDGAAPAEDAALDAN
jgi:hypothetical protein